MLVDTEQFTFREERLVLAEFYLALWSILTTFVDAEDVPLWSAVWLGHLTGKPMNASKLADETNIPRSTIRGRLDALIDKKMVVKSRDVYCIPPHWMNHPPKTHPRVRKLIIATAERLSRVADSAT